MEQDISAELLGLISSEILKIGSVIAYGFVLWLIVTWVYRAWVIPAVILAVFAGAIGLGRPYLERQQIEAAQAAVQGAAVIPEGVDLRGARVLVLTDMPDPALSDLLVGAGQAGGTIVLELAAGEIEAVQTFADLDARLSDAVRFDEGEVVQEAAETASSALEAVGYDHVLIDLSGAPAEAAAFTSPWLSAAGAPPVRLTGVFAVLSRPEMPETPIAGAAPLLFLPAWVGRAPRLPLIPGRTSPTGPREPDGIGVLARVICSAAQEERCL